MSNNWARRKFKLEISGRMANTILNALANESVDEGSDRSYEKCYDFVTKKLEEQGFWDAEMEDE